MAQIIAEAIGNFMFFLLGATLGLTGTGGGILTIPILLYFFHKPLSTAVTYSFITTGCSSLLATIRYRKQVDYKKALCIAPISMIAVMASRKMLLPLIPSHIMGIPKPTFLLYALSLFMMLGGYLMINGSHYTTMNKENTKFASTFGLVIAGGILGTLMGILGIGGGFIMMPAFVLLAGMQPRNAVATTLCIITLNATSGFLADYTNITKEDYATITWLTCISMLGIILGTTLSNGVRHDALRKIVGQLMLFVAVFNFVRSFVGT